MVAFRASLTSEGQQQLQMVLLARCSMYASRIAELEELTQADREEVRIVRERDNGFIWIFFRSWDTTWATWWSL
jgi:hypothetical protein